MLKLILLGLLSLLAGTSSATAQSICHSVKECEEVIQQAKINIANKKVEITNLQNDIFSAEGKVKELSGKVGQRVSKLGVVYELDNSVPFLGEAYRDPWGLIWGSPARTQGHVIEMNPDDAEKYCITGGARLPTKEEFEQLALNLGSHDPRGRSYSPYMNDGKTEFLPGLVNVFWTSLPLNQKMIYYGYFGENGEISLNFYVDELAVRCVKSKNN